MAGLILGGLSLLPDLIGMIGGGNSGGGGGGGGGGQGGQGGSVNQEGYGTVPDQAAYYGATAFPQYDQSALLQAREDANAVGEAKLAAVQAQAQAVITQQQVMGQLEKMKITNALSQQNMALQNQLVQAQSQAAQAQASSITGMLPYLAVGAVLLVVLMK